MADILHHFEKYEQKLISRAEGAKKICHFFSREAFVLSVVEKNQIWAKKPNRKKRTKQVQKEPKKSQKNQAKN